MQLSHKIELFPTAAQAEYFGKAAGSARFVWNWALAEWAKECEAGGKPSAMGLKKRFNALKYGQFPWLKEIHRDAHSQPFANLGKAWNRFFSDLKAKRPAHEPRFKKKGLCQDSFYVANDKFKVDGKAISLPKIGSVRMAESLRFEGRILGASVSRTADRWHVAIQVEVPDALFYRKREGEAIVGVDLGVKAAATLSTGESIEAPKPLGRALRRLKIRQRRHSRKMEAAKKAAGYEGRALPKGVRLEKSKNREKSSRALARLHARIANIRADFSHKLTTRLCRESQAVVLEDLSVRGMLANERLSRAISDVGFGMIRRQMEYKAKRFGTRLIHADRWFPSSKLCSACGWKNEDLALKDREWRCPSCGSLHDRDVNAAINLQRLATETALPVAMLFGDESAQEGMVLSRVGEVTPARDESGQKGLSGQEGNQARLCAHF